MALSFLLAPAVSWAEIPAGTFIIDLAGNQSVWLDVNEGENGFCEGFEEGFGGSLGACDFSIGIDAKGKLTGSLEVSAVNGNASVSLDGPLKGKLKGDGQTGLTSFSFSSKLSGELSNGGMPTAVSGSVGFTGQINGAGMLTGSWTGELCSKSAGCFDASPTPSPETLDGGGWALVLTIEDLGSGKLGGTGNAVLGDGTQCPYSISGKYSSKTDTASLKLSPSNAACSGSSISFKNVRRAASLTGQMSYKLFGQAGNVPVEGTDR